MSFKERIITSQTHFETFNMKKPRSCRRQVELNPLDVAKKNPLKIDSFESVFVTSEMEENRPVMAPACEYPKHRKRTRITDEEIAKQWQDVPQLNQTLKDIDSGNESGLSDSKKSFNKHRLKIVQAAGELRDWRKLANQLGVPRSTATRWVNLVGQFTNLPRGGNTRRMLDDAQIEFMIQFLREDRNRTMHEIATRLHEEFKIVISTSSISNYLQGRVIIPIRAKSDPEQTNSIELKKKRRAFVHKMVQYNAVGEFLACAITFVLPSDYTLYFAETHIVYIGEMNVEMYWKRSYTKRDGTVKRVDSRWPNIHMIGALSTRGIEKMTAQRGLLDLDAADNWLRELIETQTVDIPLKNIVIICDTCPSFIRFSEIAAELGLEFLKMPLYSFMLNPLEYLWPRVKSAASATRLVGHDLEAKLNALEEIMVTTCQSFTPIECIEAVVRSTRHYRRAEHLVDMPVDLDIEAVPRDSAT